MVYLYTVTFLLLLCITNGMVVTKYNIITPQGGEDLLSCVQSLGSYSYCAGRMNNMTCEPLKTDWCVNMTTEPSKTYLSKAMVAEVFENTLTDYYESDLPIFLHTNSEFEIRYTLRTGWSSFGFHLFYTSIDDTVLHMEMRTPNDFYFDSCVNGQWGVEEGHIGNYSHTIDLERTLKVVCGQDQFEIYVDGILEWSYTYRLPVGLGRQLSMYFEGALCDLHQMTYRA